MFSSAQITSQAQLPSVPGCGKGHWGFMDHQRVWCQGPWKKKKPGGAWWMAGQRGLSHYSPVTIVGASHHSDRLPDNLKSPCLSYHITEWNEHWLLFLLDAYLFQEKEPLKLRSSWSKLGDCAMHISITDHCEYDAKRPEFTTSSWLLQQRLPGDCTKKKRNK